jgi:tetratricopeptide (TPR) repeat protein
MPVTATLEPLVIPTYPVGVPEKNPVFFEKRVYQGSNGKVYPVPFIDRVFDTPAPVGYQSARLENEHVRLVMLPEIGGRIFIGQDKNNNDYDFFYRQDVIKPALVGLAGPWISGGVEFNWPQHHRPGTFLPADVWIEEEADGARTVWQSEHDPLHRLKGMHGIRLRPGSSLIELRGRLFNRTPVTRTFLWWANVAAMVHDQYQSFFPPDVHYVADHAVRAMSSFPIANNHYYGVNYAARPGANDLSWYRNIPVPTSYMICQTHFDFFGGYDHRAGGGFVHVADRHVAPGKKQWTWGDHAFGYAWDRELTDANGPYIELMAGVYTDNQPDFTYLAPYETKTFSQFWWPIQGIGPVQQANQEAALRLVVRPENRQIDASLCVPAPLPGARFVLREHGRVVFEKQLDLVPGKIWKCNAGKLAGENESALQAILLDANGREILSYQPPVVNRNERAREVATEPPAPAGIGSSDELYLTGEHLELYRHPTRDPRDYWEEVLRRDPGDSRANLAMGRSLLRQGCYEIAIGHLAKAVARLTFRHPNPETGEAHYVLGLALARTGRDAEALPCLAKAKWNSAWRVPAGIQSACLLARAGDFSRAVEEVDEVLAMDGRCTLAFVLRGLWLWKLGQSECAKRDHRETLAQDPLDHAARWLGCLLGEIETEDFLSICRNDAQTILDLVFDLAEAGLPEEAAKLLDLHHTHPVPACAVPNPLARTSMTRYTLAWLRRDDSLLAEARLGEPDYFFPSRPEEQRVLEWALSRPGQDPLAAYGYGNLCYDQRRHDEAIALWERSIADGAAFSIVHRNLGIAVWNRHRDGERATACYETARALNPHDARLLCELDQLRAKRNVDPAGRLADLEKHLPLVLERDDCTVAYLTLLNLHGCSREALDILTTRRFHPWEGGEGSVLRQFTTAHLLLGREALESGDAATALDHFTNAMETPPNLGEAYHLLQAKADVNYWLGRALRDLGREDEARAAFEASANEAGDFAEMAVTSHSPLSYYRGLSLRELGREDEARAVFESLRAFGTKGLAETARIDYFATSLPNLLVFEEDLQARRAAESHLLIALAERGLGNSKAARAEMERVLAFNRAEPWAREIG